MKLKIINNQCVIDISIINSIFNGKIKNKKKVSNFDEV